MINGYEDIFRKTNNLNVNILEKIAQKARKAQKEKNRNNLLQAILECYKYLDREYPGQYFGAVKIDNILELEKIGHSSGTHNILKELKDRGYLEQAYRRGFRLKMKKI